MTGLNMHELNTQELNEHAAELEWTRTAWMNTQEDLNAQTERWMDMQAANEHAKWTCRMTQMNMQNQRNEHAEWAEWTRRMSLMNMPIELKEHANWAEWTRQMTQMKA